MKDATSSRNPAEEWMAQCFRDGNELLRRMPRSEELSAEINLFDRIAESVIRILQRVMA